MGFPISVQYDHFITPEYNKNIWFSGVLRGYDMGALARNGLIYSLPSKNHI